MRTQLCFNDVHKLWILPRYTRKYSSYLRKYKRKKAVSQRMEL